MPSHLATSLASWYAWDRCRGTTPSHVHGGYVKDLSHLFPASYLGYVKT